MVEIAASDEEEAGGRVGVKPGNGPGSNGPTGSFPIPGLTAHYIVSY